MYHLTREAETAIGSGRFDAFRLDHVKSFPPQAGPLVRLLQRPELQKLVAEYEPTDAAATRAQRRMRQLERVDTWARALQAAARPIAIGIGLVFAASIGGLIDLGALSSLTDNREVSRWAFHIEFAALGLILLVQLILTQFQPYERSLRVTADAARKRDALFLTLMSLEEKSRPGELPLLPLQLEFFRRFYLEINLAYFATRLNQHRGRLGWPGTAALLTAVAIVILCVWFVGRNRLLPIDPFHVERGFFCSPLRLRSSLERTSWRPRARGEQSSRCRSLGTTSATYPTPGCPERERPQPPTTRG